MIPTLPIHASSFRVFRGYKKADIAEEAFLKDLGESFMPGTPLMLRELGLAAYLPTVLPKVPEVVDLPDEVAIIAYPSRERYSWARNQTIVGRMYTYTHLAVFDMTTSRSVFPEPIGTSQDPIKAFYALGTLCDWQGDGDVVFWAGHKQDDITDSFPDKFLAELTALVPSLQTAGVRECVGQVSSTWAVAWLLLDKHNNSGVPSIIANDLEKGLPATVGVMTQLVQRQLWRDSVPAIQATRASSHSFIFQRELRHFIY
jgi:hypothetical protein